MNKYLFAGFGLLYSLTGFSAEVDFSAMNELTMSYEKLHKCLKTGWEASSPTDSQNTSAEKLVEAAKKTISDQKSVLKTDKDAVCAAWAASPVVDQDVETAEERLHTDLAPVKMAVRTDIVNILNLLSSDQKKMFNTAFKDCIK